CPSVAAARGQFGGVAERARSALALGLRSRHILVAEEAGDLDEADDRVDAAVRARSLAAACEGFELGIDLRGELGEQVELVGPSRGAVGERVVANLVIE